MAVARPKRGAKRRAFLPRHDYDVRQPAAGCIRRDAGADSRLGSQYAESISAAEVTTRVRNADKITATNVGTGYRLTTATGSTGTYEFTPIRIGTYAMQAQASGFATDTRADIVVHVQRQVVVDFTLQPGQLTQVVEVTGAATHSAQSLG
jgi:hypothetical protein